jgi:hypothetical protein
VFRHALAIGMIGLVPIVDCTRWPSRPVTPGPTSDNPKLDAEHQIVFEVKGLT